MAKKSELVGSNANSRNWKGLAISVLVIVIVFTLIVVAVIVKRPPPKDNLDFKPLSLDEIIHKNFEPKRFNGIWLNNRQFAYMTDNSNIMLYDCQNLNQTLLLPNSTINPLIGSNFKFFMGSDPNVILFSYDIKNVYRHSNTARYKLYNTATRGQYDVSPSNSEDEVSLQNTLISPNSKKLAFVYQNNIYLVENFFDSQKNLIQLTNDGLENTIYNGITDWLYEEEILLQTNAMWWSPESSKLAYLKFNDSLVEYYHFPIYDGTPYGSLNKVRYPKPDTKNPKVSIYIYSDQTKNSTELPIPKNFLLTDFYIQNIKWQTDDTLIVVFLNRKQNHAITVIYDANSGQIKMQKLYPSMNTDTWLIPSGLLTTANYYFQIWPYNGYKSVLSFDLSKKSDVQVITNHKFDVTDLLTVNEKSDDLYYLATNGDPKQRHLFRKKLSDINSQSECLTCVDKESVPKHTNPIDNSVDIAEGKACLYYSASFSTNADFYVLECLGDRIPVSYIKSVQEKRGSSDIDEEKQIFERNEDLKQNLYKRLLPKKAYLRVYLDNDTHAYSDAEILYPPNFDPLETMYPVLIYVYNGPSTQQVDFQFRIRKFESYLCVNYNVIVAVIDGRGTDSNGDAYMKAVYKHLGKLESQDQISLAEALKQEYYTDDAKFAIWGWSYGGFISAMSLFNESTPFGCAISGAPVTDWTYYDSAYTERYLGSYAHNRKGYEDSSLIETIIKNNKHNTQYLSKKKLLLIHGTGDDNVHFQNSAVLAKVLRNTNLELDFDIYPDMQHSPDERKQLLLYQKMTKYLLDCYGLNYHDYYEQLSYHHLLVDINSSNSEDEPKE